MPRLQMRIKTKFSAFSICLIAITAVLISAMMFMAEKKLIEKRFRKQMAQTITAFAQVARESLLSKDDLMLISYIGILKKDDAVSYALYADETGNIIAHSDLQYLYTKFESAGEDTTRSEPVFYDLTDVTGEKTTEIAFPVTLANEFRGSVRIGYSGRIMAERINDALAEIMNTIAQITALVMLIGLVLSFMAARSLTNPIIIIADAADKIGQGKLDTTVNVKTKDELGWLAMRINQMAEQLKELDRMKDDFVSSVSHELRSPMTAIEGYIDLLLADEELMKIGRYTKALRIMKNSTIRLTRFVNDVLDMAKLESGKVVLNYEPADVRSILDELVMFYKPLAEEKEIKLLFEPTANTADISIPMDKDKITQVVTNLVSNALKFTPKAGSITLDCVDEAQFVKFTVTDTGIGIPADQAEKVFSKFEQVQGLKQKIKGAKGTGLGLAIAKGFIEMHGGKIGLTSELNTGSCFYFTLPKNPPEEDAAKPETS